MRGSLKIRNIHDEVQSLSARGDTLQSLGAMTGKTCVLGDGNGSFSLRRRDQRKGQDNHRDEGAGKILHKNRIGATPPDLQ